MLQFLPNTNIATRERDVDCETRRVIYEVTDMARHYPSLARGPDTAFRSGRGPRLVAPRGTRLCFTRDVDGAAVLLSSPRPSAHHRPLARRARYLRFSSLTQLVYTTSCLAVERVERVLESASVLVASCGAASRATVPLT